MPLRIGRYPVWLVCFALAAPASAGCTKKNPAFCESAEDCDDPSAPFCDVDGSFGGTANACIPDPNVPADAGTPDAVAPDARPLPDAAPARVEALRQTSTAAGRLSGSTYTIDAQVGRPVSPTAATGGDKTIRTASPVE